MLLGGGPWGSAGGRNLPTLESRIDLTRHALAAGVPVLGIGLGAQILAIAAGGSAATPSGLEFEVARPSARDRTRSPASCRSAIRSCIYGRDRPLPPPDATSSRATRRADPRCSRSASALGFTGHPGIKAAMVEDLIMEFEEAPADPGPALARLRAVQPGARGRAGADHDRRRPQLRLDGVTATRGDTYCMRRLRLH